MAKSRHNDQKPVLPEVLDALIETLPQALQQRDRLQVGTGAERAAGAGQPTSPRVAVAAPSMWTRVKEHAAVSAMVGCVDETRFQA